MSGNNNRVLVTGVLAFWDLIYARNWLLPVTMYYVLTIFIRVARTA